MSKFPSGRYLAVARAPLLLLSILLVPSNVIGQSASPSCQTGKPPSSWNNCQGTYTYQNGDKYVGEFKNGKRNGQGTQTFANGDMYVGGWNDDFRHGQGTYTNKKGATYVGDWRGGKRNGQGTYTFANGETYVGGWNSDFRSGIGTYRYENGDKYVGEWNDNIRSGQGTYYTHDNGAKSVGEWKDDNRNGRQIVTFGNGDAFVGEYKNDKRNGQGTATFADGRKYIGEWKDGKNDGLGTLYGADGSVIRSGLWKEGKFIQAVAQKPPSTSIEAAQAQRVALIIGNSNYRHANLLPNPVNDAQLLASTLKIVGFQSVTVKIDLTREQTLQALQEFARITDDADWAVVYYSGHGIEFSGTNYLIPIDAELKVDRDIDLQAVDLGKVLNAVESARKLRLVILDACRDNPFAGQMRRTMASRSMGRGLAQIEPGAGTLVEYAAKHGETALDGSGSNSPFLESLVKRIQERPPLELRRLFDFVRDDVMETTKKQQQPFSYGSLSARDDFYF